MEHKVEQRGVIWMTMILVLLMLPLYIFSYNLENWPILIFLFIFERFATPFTGKTFGDAIDQIGDLLDHELSPKESRKMMAIIIALLVFVIVIIGMYIYILFTAPLLFVLLMAAEVIDKVIEKLILKRA